jgi:hypothetical protein
MALRRYGRTAGSLMRRMKWRFSAASSKASVNPMGNLKLDALQNIPR